LTVQSFELFFKCDDPRVFSGKVLFHATQLADVLCDRGGALLGRCLAGGVQLLETGRGSAKVLAGLVDLVHPPVFGSAMECFERRALGCRFAACSEQGSLRDF